MNVDSKTGLLPAKRILVMRYRFIGDTILTVPFLRNLRNAYKDAKIDVLVGPESGMVLQGCPYIDELIPFDTTRFHKYDRGQDGPRSFMSYAFELRGRAYDLVFVLKRSWSSAFLSWLSGARWRIGYDTEGRGLFLTCRRRWDKSVHEVESLLDLLRAANVPVRDDHLEAFVSRQEREQILHMVPELDGKRPRMLVHAAAARADKMYPLAHWAPVVKRLHDEFGVLPFFTGAEQDRSIYKDLEDMSGVAGVNLAGKLSLKQSIALYERLDLAVCVDSGPAHLAAAAGVPTVALFGPTDPGRWRPWGAKHVAVFDPDSWQRKCQFHADCRVQRCLSKLDTEMVLSKCREVLAREKIEVRETPGDSRDGK